MLELLRQPTSRTWTAGVGEPRSSGRWRRCASTPARCWASTRTSSRRPAPADAGGQGLLLDIRLLVADEIISMLDASTRIDVLNLLGDLKAKGWHPVHHPRPVAGQLHQRHAVILHRGEVVEDRSTSQVFGQPQHPHPVAASLGATAAPQMGAERAPGPRAGREGG